MKRTLDAYLLRLDDWIDPETCRTAVAALEAAPWRLHTYSVTGETEAHSLGGEQELEISFAGDDAVTASITRRIVAATRLYAIRLQLPWLSPPTHHSALRYNRYTPGQRMLEHYDRIELFDTVEQGVPILSCLAVLNDDYAGGELVMWGDTVIPAPTGTTIIFPSTFLYPHRVEPVSAGTRYSCVSWAL